MMHAVSTETRGAAKLDDNCLWVHHYKQLIYITHIHYTHKNIDYSSFKVYWGTCARCKAKRWSGCRSNSQIKCTKAEYLHWETSFPHDTDVHFFSSKRWEASPLITNFLLCINECSVSCSVSLWRCFIQQKLLLCILASSWGYMAVKCTLIFGEIFSDYINACMMQINS